MLINWSKMDLFRNILKQLLRYYYAICAAIMKNLGNKMSQICSEQSKLILWEDSTIESVLNQFTGNNCQLFKWNGATNIRYAYRVASFAKWTRKRNLRSYSQKQIKTKIECPNSSFGEGILCMYSTMYPKIKRLPFRILSLEYAIASLLCRKISCSCALQRANYIHELTSIWPAYAVCCGSIICASANQAWIRIGIEIQHPLLLSTFWRLHDLSRLPWVWLADFFEASLRV